MKIFLSWLNFVKIAFYFAFTLPNKQFFKTLFGFIWVNDQILWFFENNSVNSLIFGSLVTLQDHGLVSEILKKKEFFLEKN